MSIPANLQYTREHEWVRIEGDLAHVGITQFAADALGDIVYVDLPKVGASIVSGSIVGEAESTKSVGELYAPVSGEVVATNSAVVDSPELVNSDPYGEGWMFTVRFTDTVELISADDYEAHIAE
ncbi:glycine cleavage system H protein [Microbacteriaceae bacterium MWH-Ta3]|nr:glycine cleavage system H protein [Microbacteriaceae bacterium MWH-Ta3]